LKNTAQRASALYVGDDAQLENLNITGNNSGDGYALYFESGEFDGGSYVSHKIKICGDMKVCDNSGSKPDMFIGADQVIAIGAPGLTKGTKMNVELAEGILTNTLIGAYDYEGGNQKYLVTCGDRSVTDPEPIPGVQELNPEIEPTESVPDNGSNGVGVAGMIAIGVAVVAIVIAALVAAATKKKKKSSKYARNRENK